MIIQYFYQPFPVFELESDNVILRELHHYDAGNYFKYMNHPEMFPYLTEATRPSSIEQAIEEVQYWASLFQNKRSFYWAIALKSSNQLIGTIGFNSISISHLKGEISYDLDPSFWGQGIMLKSLKTLLNFADSSLRLVRIQATVIINNQRSIKLLEKCGFSSEGVLKKYEVVNGQHLDYYMYSRVDPSPSRL